MATFTDDFNRETLGPDWTALHYDGSGSVSLDGAGVTIDSAGSGDFAGTADTGSMIYRPIPVSNTPGKVAKVITEVTVLTTGLGTYQRMLTLRAGTANNAAFLQLVTTNQTKFQWYRRSYPGVACDWLGDSGPVAYDNTKAIRLRFISWETCVEFWVSQDAGVTWSSVGLVGVDPSQKLQYACLVDSLHGSALKYDDFSCVDVLEDPAPAQFLISASGVGDLYYGGKGMISGTVKVKGSPNVPVYRNVRLLDKKTLMMVKDTWSDPVTGAYEFTQLDTSILYYVVAADYTLTYPPVVSGVVTPNAVTPTQVDLLFADPNAAVVLPTIGFPIIG